MTEPDPLLGRPAVRARIEALAFTAMALLCVPGLLVALSRADLAAFLPVAVAVALWSSVAALAVRSLRRGQLVARGLVAVALATDTVLMTLSGLSPPRIGNITVAALALLALCAAAGLLVPPRWVPVTVVPALAGQVALLQAADAGAGAGRLVADVAGTVTLTLAVTGIIVWLGHERDRAAAALHRAATTDPLTGLLNRRGLDLAHRRLVAEPTGRTRPVLAVVVVDIDHFKSVNDRRGHEIGDEVLVTVARVLRESCRAGSDAVVRLGGEELAWLARWPSAEATVEAAERLRAEIARVTATTTEAVTVSAGVAADVPGPTHDETDLARLLNRADQALYCAKQEGRDRVRVAGAEATDTDGRRDRHRVALDDSPNGAR
ncbi:diguanylate cyclase [Kineococcus gynurae]|uniref:Diguanylate cyclase n=1 Tax=Kineococcus gynurae TaxID=452979 RepID=A0ABV5LPX8_9ACTN